MSVILFNVDEVATVLAQYQATHTRLAHVPTVDEFGCALRAFHYANTAAYAMTYDSAENQGVSYQPIQQALREVCPQFTSLRDVNETQRNIVRQLRSFKYNAISNGGTDFLPANYHHIFDQVIRAITDRLARI